MSGTAMLGTHYTLSGTPNQVTIPSGASSATVTLKALMTTLSSGSEIAAMTIITESRRKAGTAKTATVTINNIP
jgi:alcohol dehydrogenase class IV